ncbi:MAG: NAD(P)/FAD-dependent oxidoreductase [Clostridiales bacterium]|jgi:electron-transferring-flavoprotein dehydrogenase|nr:NAD(P)/FAD-dependent oxidoreductase [Clostridiales bacterium]
MKENYDVMVVGSGTAGIYFAKLMAEQGYSVGVFDAAPKERLGARLNIFHTDAEKFAEFGIPEPKAGDEDYVGYFEYGITKSALDNYPKRTYYGFTVLLLPPYLKRLRGWAEGFGAEFFYDASFTDFIYDENGRVSGAKIRTGGEIRMISARLVADCSGIPSVARRKLKDGGTVENFEIGPRDKFYVILRYVKFKKPEDRVTLSTGWAYYKTWLGPSYDPSRAIAGVGSNLSFDYAEKCYQRFLDRVKLPEFEIDRIERGETPYRRSPYALCTDGFVCLGDAACMTKPYSGEGITSGWVFCRIAAEVAGKIMKGGAYPTEEKLWEANARYARTQGADFAYLFAMLCNAVDCTAEENDFEFKKDIVFAEKTMTDMNRNFNADMPLKDALKLGLRAAGGFLAGKLSPKTMRALLKGLGVAGKLKSHYKKYPETPDGFWAWKQKADELWEKAGSMADMIDKIEAGA